MADQSLSATYTASRKTADDAELERWLAEKPPPPVLGPPTPQPGQGAEKPPEKPGALAAIGGAIKDTFTEGASHFIAGLGNRPKSAMDFEGAGQQVLGLMQMLAALPAGAGAAFKQALGKFAPGLEGDVAIKGGGAGETTTAGIVRSVLGAPIAMMLDPKMKAEIAKNPVPFAEALNADMTYGELADIVGQTIGIPLTMKAGRAVVGRAKGGPAAPGATPEAPPAAPTEPRAPLALSEHTEALVTPPPSASSAFETRIRAAQLEGPEAYARVVADELRMALEQADAPPKFADVLREKYRPAAPEEGPPRAAMEPAAPAAAAPEGAVTPEVPPISGGSLPAVMERALVQSERTISEALTTVTSRTKARKAKPPKEPETPVAPPEEGAAPKAADPLAALSKDEIDSVMGSLDLMYTELKEAAPGARHLITDDMGKVEGALRQPSTYPDFMDAVIGKKTRANADKLMDVIDDIQAGKIDTPLHRTMVEYARAHWDEWAGHFDLGAEGGAVSPALLARMALGAAAGGSQGDRPEERIAFAFAGMGMGAVMSKRLAAKVAQSYKQSGLADESGALDFSKWRKKPAVQESEQPFQPNYARIEATPDVKAVMKNIHRMMKEDILERRGPARSNDQRVLEASELIRSEKMTPERVLTLGDKEMLTDTEVTAARMISVRASQHAAEIRDQVVAGQAVPEGTLKQSIAIAGAIARNTRVAQTRIAQAQQAGAIRVRGEGVGYRPEDVANLADEIAPGMTDQQVATMMNKMKPIDQVERFSVWMTLFPKMLLQGVYFSYLSGKATARNVVGNLSMMGLAPVERGIGRFMPLWGDPKPGIVPGEATQMARTLGESLWDQLRMVRHLDEIEAAAVKEGVNISSVKSDRRAPSGREFVEGVTENQSLQRLGDWWDNITTFPGKVLDQTDVMSKTANARMQHSAEAMRQATFEGHTGEALEARRVELMDDITQLSDTSRQRITDFADRQTFTQDFEGKMLRALSQGPENEWLNLGYRSFIMPFFRVTARMTEATLARTPGLNFLAKQFWTDWNAGGAQRQLAQARVVGGAATIGAFMYLEGQGGLTGNAPKDATLRKLWQDAGYQERSWWDGSQWRSYDGLGPLTSLIAGAADTSMMARKLPEQTGATLTFAYVLSQINTLDSRTFMQSLSHLGDVIKTKNSDTQIEKGMEVLRRQVAGWMKPGVLRELETLTDPEIRRALRSGAYEEGSFQQEWNTLLDEVRAGMPGWSAARDAEGSFLIPPARHRITGEPTIVDSYPFNPMPGRTPKDIAVKKPDGTMTGVSAEILRLNGAGLDEWPEWMGPMAPKASYGLTTPNPRAGVRLTNQERDRYAVLFSQEIKNADGQTYAQALKATLEDPNYWAESDGMPLGTNSGKAAWLQRLDRDFAQMTKEALFMEGRSAEGQPGALERTLLEKQAEAGIQKTPTAQQPEVRGLVEDTLRTLRGLPSTLSR